MSRPKEKRVTHAITINLPPELADALQAAAYERAIGRSILIEALLRRGLEGLQPVEQFLFGAQSGNSPTPRSQS